MPAAATVKLLAATFEPDIVNIKVGETVRWVWTSSIQHNVDGGAAFKSKLQATGDFTHTFDTAGTYDYRCDVHPTTMKGKVIVA